MEKEYDPQELAEQKDPLVIYLIVRESLGMSAGKMGAQIAHATQKLFESYYLHFLDDPLLTGLMQEWKEESCRKVVLKADDKEWEKLKTEFPQAFIVRDAGLTEVDPGSETVMALWPMRKSERPKVLKRLQVLK